MAEYSDRKILYTGAAGGLGRRLRGGQRGAEVALHALGGRPHIIRVRETEILGEPLLQGKERELVAEVPLPMQAVA